MTATENNPKLDAFEMHRQARELRAQAIGQGFEAVMKAAQGWLLRHILEPIQHRATQRRQFDELMSMDDHMLRDLGLARGNIAYSFQHGRDPVVPKPANTNDPAHKAA